MATAAVFALGLLVSVYLQDCSAAHSGIAPPHAHHLVRQDERSRHRDRGDKGAESGAGRKIPSLLHYVYLQGFDAFVEEAKKPTSTVLKERFESCQTVHQHWDSVFWDEAAALKLLNEHYPWFVPTWESYDLPDKKSDALRVFIMHRFGGLYLDLDIECYKAADNSFKKYDVVLQGTGDEGFNNAVMASIPGHPLWSLYAKILVERSTQGSDTTTKSPMWMTGTLALTQTLFKFIKNSKRPVSGYLGGIFQVEESTIKISPLGEWYVPCYGMDLICLRQFEKGRQTGEWDMTNIYGRHYFAETTNPAVIQEKLLPHNVTRL